MNQNDFRKIAEAAVKPFMDKLVDTLVESKDILESSFPPQFPMEERSKIFNQMINDSLSSITKVFEAMDLEKIKSDLEKRFKDGVNDQKEEQECNFNLRENGTVSE
jgi:hypothetical protein